MKYINFFGREIEADKLKNRAVSIFKDIALVFLSLLTGFAIWIILSL